MTSSEKSTELNKFQIGRNSALFTLIAFTALMYGIYWKSHSVHVDERFTTVLANGVKLSGTKVVDRIDTAYYQNISLAEFRNQNTYPRVVHNVIQDGGNGLFYYFFAHGISKSLGRYFGVFASIKLLNIIIALISAYVLFRFLLRQMKVESALFGSILYIACSVQFGILNRNYGMSNLIFLIYFILLLKLLKKEQKTRDFHLAGLYFVVAVLPFVHFMNTVLMTLAALGFVVISRKQLQTQKQQASSDTSQKQQQQKHFQHLIAMHLLSAVIFGIFYFGFNQEGRNFQSMINAYWAQFASNYGTEQNTWLMPFSVKNAIIENTELLLRLTGLDLRDSFPALRISTFIILLVLPIIFAFSIIRKYFRNEVAEFKSAILVSTIICIGFLGFLNLLYFAANHAIPLNSQWYCSSLFVCLSVLAAIGFQLHRSRKVKSIMWLFLLVVVINSINQGLHPVHKDTNDPSMQLVMQLTENQFL